MSNETETKRFVLFGVYCSSELESFGCKEAASDLMEKSYASASSGELGVVAGGGGRSVRVIPLRHPQEAVAGSSPSWWSVVMVKARGMGPRDWAEAALPCLSWMRTYRLKEDLQADLAAGSTVGVMLVPQGHSLPS